MTTCGACMRRPAVGALVGLVVLVALLAGCAADGEEDIGGATAASDDHAGAGADEPGDDRGSAEVFAAVDADGPGCAAAVRVGAEVVWEGQAGLADVDDGVPIAADTVFDVGSTSKPFTATLVLLLDEAGRLDVDAPVAEVVDGLPAWAEEVTLDQLLHHTAAVPDYVELLADEGYDDEDTTTADDALDALAEVDELDGEPGESFAYSNSGYLLAAEAVEAATGTPFADVAEEQLFSPYGLDAEFAPVTDDPRRATSYDADGDTWVVADSAWEQVGDGGLQTTPAELVRWAGELWDPVLGDAVDEARLAGAVPDEEAGGDYGYGIGIDEDDELGTVLSHAGSWAGFLADLVVLPDDEVAAAVTCNTTDLVDPSEAARELASIWLDG